MQPRIKSVLVLGMLLGAITVAHGFSLLGPLDGNAWQTAPLGYAQARDIGSPMNVGEEYRWNCPYITYAFDQTFLNYFGKQGMDAVDQAIAILNSLPACSNMTADLSEFPLDNKKVNYTAKAMNLIDLKSTTLCVLLEVMGLAAPERWVYSLRARQTRTVNNITYTNYLVIMRNFDPITYQPTNRVNSAFYGYVIDEPLLPGNYADALETVMDPLTIVPYSSVAGSMEAGWGSVFSSGGTTIPMGKAGELFTGLTRDDVGGWRYLLRYRNLNNENLPATVGIPYWMLTNATNFLVTNAVVSSYMTNSPWRPYLGGTNSYTNYLYTNYFIYTNPPWTIYLSQTNQLSTNSTVTNAFGTNITGSNILVQAALRPGVEKITFIKTMYDSYLGQAYTPITNFYTDVTISNFLVVTQMVQRVTAAPDILFVAADLGMSGGTYPTPVLTRRGVNFINNNAINTHGGALPAGPGNLAPPILISYSDILPAFINEWGPNEEPGTQNNYIWRSPVWGSYGPTMDQPINIYPNWISLQELENLILGTQSAP